VSRSAINTFFSRSISIPSRSSIRRGDTQFWTHTTAMPIHLSTSSDHSKACAWPPSLSWSPLTKHGGLDDAFLFGPHPAAYSSLHRHQWNIRDTDRPDGTEHAMACRTRASRAVPMLVNRNLAKHGLRSTSTSAPSRPCTSAPGTKKCAPEYLQAFCRPTRDLMNSSPARRWQPPPGEEDAASANPQGGLSLPPDQAAERLRLRAHVSRRASRRQCTEIRARLSRPPKPKPG